MGGGGGKVKEQSYRAGEGVGEGVGRFLKMCVSKQHFFFFFFLGGAIIRGTFCSGIDQFPPSSSFLPLF